MSDTKYGLQLMSDDYILENLIGLVWNRCVRRHATMRPGRRGGHGGRYRIIGLRKNNTLANCCWVLFENKFVTLYHIMSFSFMRGLFCIAFMSMFLHLQRYEHFFKITTTMEPFRCFPRRPWSGDERRITLLTLSEGVTEVLFVQTLLSRTSIFQTHNQRQNHGWKIQ